MVHGQKRIDEDGITLAVNECDGIRNPRQIFLARGEPLGRATALLCQKLPVQPSHVLLSHSVGIHKGAWLANASGLKTCVGAGSSLLRIRHLRMTERRLRILLLLASRRGQHSPWWF